MDIGKARTHTNRYRLIILPLLFAGLVACTQVSPPPAAGVTVIIDQGDIQLVIGESLTLGATVAVPDGPTAEVSWASSNAAIATVSAIGVVEALAVGETTITATSTFDPLKSDSVQITVIPAATADWTRQFGSTAWDEAEDVAVDSAGNIIVVGRTEGAMGGSFAGASDVFVMKIDSGGNPMWTDQFGTSGYEYAAAVAVDSTGNIFVVGSTTGSLAAPGAGDEDVFLRKYDPDGAILWTRQYSSGTWDFGTGIAVDSQGDVIIIGATSGLMGDSSAGSEDVFVMKVDSGGTVDWTRQFGSSASDHASGVAIDSDGAIIVVGTTAGAIGEANAGDWDGFVSKLDSDGTPEWNHQFGTSLWDGAYAVAVDNDGSVLVTGQTFGELGDSSTGKRDVFVMKLESDGSQAVWTDQFGSGILDFGHSTAVNPDGTSVVVGTTFGLLGDETMGSSDAFIRWVDADGVAVSTIQFGTDQPDSATGVAVHPDGSVVIVGYTQGVLGAASAGSMDLFVRKLQQGDL